MSDSLEARCRQIMARRVTARGWDGQRQRAEWLAEVDAALDAWLMS